MSRTMQALLAVQIFTFVCFGVISLRNGETRLGVAQLLLAVVQYVIYSGSMA
jgi:hypothetical protein